ncbi:type III secretion system export apparatus subunit SctV [Roseateles sp. NT4]|uniref:type III secretion system export apparatus subunit SctV n=1 Tax=Roseateles sp. NT4 TaxID=3453715 RepID=UPI003EEDF63E
MNSDVALAGLLVVVVALFVIPLPTSVLDVLIAINLAASLVLLFVAIYVPSATSLSTFPSLLLFTTLFRLALNIASTKLILLQAKAGHIIDTFGKLIVGNNVVVGGVVFLIIAIVQFVVIAKGAERVAEVAARFALDAMPGKQMSIDADVRAGSMSAAEAQQRRQALEQESSLHGAMDGAMKFVKGDAIASIIVAIVNIVAGLTIGVLMKGMNAADALHRYAILTVGDGMVSQIPSLLVSIAAGLVITRVGGASGAPLATQIGRQLAAHPRALVIAGIAFSSFLLVPGFPVWVFALLSLGLIAVGVSARRAHEWRRTPSWIAHDEGDLPHAVAAPLVVRIASDLHAGLDRHELDRRLAVGKGQFEGELGPVFPQLRVERVSAVSRFSYEILVEDVVVSHGALRPGWTLLDPTAVVGVPAGAEVAEPFGPFPRAVWMRGKHLDVAGWSCEEVIALHVGHVVRSHVPHLIGLQEVQRMLRLLQVDAPEVATETVRAVPTQRIAEVLRRLVQEGIPVRNVRAIFESLVMHSPQEADVIALTERVRVDLGRFITSKYAPHRRVDAVLFESAFLDRVLSSIERSARGNLLLLDPVVAKDAREQVKRLLDASPSGTVVVASVDTRRYIKTLLEPISPSLTVLSYQELEPDVAINPVGWVANPQTV